MAEEIEIEEIVKEYLRQNLKIEIDVDDYDPGYDYGGSISVGINVKLEGETIASDSFSIDRK